MIFSTANQASTGAHHLDFYIAPGGGQHVEAQINSIFGTSTYHAYR